MSESNAVPQPAIIGRPIRVNEKLSLGRASVILAAMIFLSRLAGFGRVNLTTHFYGRGPAADAFNTAFAIPETMSIVIAGGALATGFVPTFTALLTKGDHQAARHTFRALLTLICLVSGVLTFGAIALTYTPLVEKVVPKHLDLPLYCANLRLLLLAQFIFIIGGVFTGTFNSLRLFWMPALQPVCFNLGIIAFGFWGAHYHLGITSQAFGALVGALLGSLLVQAPVAAWAGLSLKPVWDLHDEGVRRVLRSIVPVFFGLASGRILCLSLPLQLAAWDPGGATSIESATRFMILPLELLATGSAIAAFPTLSKLSSEGRQEEMAQLLSQILRRTLKLLVLATVGLVIVAKPLIFALLVNGKFTAHDGIVTSRVLMVSALALPGLGIQQLLSRGFFALGDNTTPVIAGVVAMGVFLLLGSFNLVVLHTGAIGVTLASVVAVSLLAAVLWKGLEKRIGSLWQTAGTDTSGI